MPTVSQIMSTDVQCVEPQHTLQQAAQLMDRLNVGSLPVVQDRRLIGMVTDRDITVRGTAAGLAPGSTRIGDVMTERACCCQADESIEEVQRLMGDAQVRRLPVVDSDGMVIGIVSLGDLATRQPASVDETVREISSPSEADGGDAQS
ncbi:MAG: CBS domain-containing protein [Rubrivivax sp.]